MVGRYQTKDRVCRASHLQSGTTNKPSSPRLRFSATYLIDQAWSEAVSSAALLLCSCCSLPTSWSQHSSLLQYSCHSSTPARLPLLPPPYLFFLSSLFLYATTLLPFSSLLWEREQKRERESKREAVTCITLVGTVCKLPCTVKSKKRQLSWICPTHKRKLWNSHRISRAKSEGPLAWPLIKILLLQKRSKDAQLFWLDRFS